MKVREKEVNKQKYIVKNHFLKLCGCLKCTLENCMGCSLPQDKLLRYAAMGNTGRVYDK